MLELKRARPVDAAALAETSKQAFHSDVDYGGLAESGPPGYASPEWQRKMMSIGDYHRVVLDGETIGGLIVFRKAPREYELGRIFLGPSHQNQGLGAQVMQLLWAEYPLAKRWTLGTPAWNARTRHFYAKVGFEEVGQDGHGGVLFEKRMQAATL